MTTANVKTVSTLCMCLHHTDIGEGLRSVSFSILAASAAQTRSYTNYIYWDTPNYIKQYILYLCPVHSEDLCAYFLLQASVGWTETTSCITKIKQRTSAGLLK